MRFLSLFSGIEAATQAWQPLGWECVAVSEIEPFPCAVLAHHYPNVPNLGDVTKITEQQIKDLGQIDLVVFGSPCFVAGTTVISKDGLKPIETIAIGDEVLTHGNRFRPVVSVGGKKAQEVYEVRASGLLPTIATAEHPYYTRETKRVWNSSKRGWDRVYGEPDWVEVKDLKNNHLLAIPVLQTSENPLNLTDEECFIVGRYIADGHTAKHYRNTEGRPNDRHWQLILSVGNNKVDDFTNQISENHYSLFSHSKNVKRAVFSSKRLVEIVEAHCGCGAENKRLSTTLLNLPIDKLERVIDGYVSGDGWLRNGTEYRVTTVSVELVRSLQLAVAKVYRTATMTNFFERPKTTVIEGRTVNQKDTYIVSFRKERPRQAKYFYENGFIWTRFKSAIKLGCKHDVFNLEVADDNSYTANNAVVHNCQNLSVAGNRMGLAGEQSSLFYAAMEIISYARKHCNTRFALWENVPGAFSSNKGADFTEVVKHMAGFRELDTPKNGWGKEGAAVGDNGLLEWCVLDAQFFGLAQRRKRVFAIVDFGEWERRPPILLERESLRGDTAPSREAGQSAAATARASAKGESWHSVDTQQPPARIYDEIAPCLAASMYKEPISVMRLPRNECYQDVVGALCARDYKGVGNQYVAENKLVVAVAGNIIGRAPKNGGGGIGFDTSGACYTLTATDRHVVCIGGQHPNASINHGNSSPTLTSAMGMSGGHTPCVAYTINTMNCQGRPADNGRLGLGIGNANDPCPTLTKNHSHAVAYGFATKQMGLDLTEECGNTLCANDFKEPQAVFKPQAHPTTSVIRRLTPKEAERLQGFPDNWTKIPYRGKPASDCPDSPRYKALGNSMAVNVMAWIGQQIDNALFYETLFEENP